MRGLFLHVHVDGGLGGRETAARFWMKSPRWAPSSSPTGVSSEIVACAIFNTLRTLAWGMSMPGLKVPLTARRDSLSCGSYRLDVLCLQALAALYDIELHLLTLLQATVYRVGRTPSTGCLTLGRVPSKPAFGLLGWTTGFAKGGDFPK